MAEKELTFKYVFGDNYNPSYANGAYGGIGPNGDLIMHFYQERPPVPNSVKVEFSQDGKITKVENSPINPPVIRYIVSGITMNLESAKQLNVWLDGIIKSVEKNEK